jgi:hypothetical protein
MDPQEFDSTAREIARRNVGDSVKAVSARFEPDQARLVVTYYLHDAPTEEDWDDCEMTCSQVLEAFPEIRVTEAQCLESPEADRAIADLIYLQ